MWPQIVTVVFVVAIVVAVALRNKRWRNRHKDDPQPEIPVIAGASAFTGELIATGQANSELGDGTPPVCGSP